MDAQGAVKPVETNPLIGLSQSEADHQIKTFGYNEVQASKANPLLLLAKKFWGLSAWMLELIIGLSWFLHRFLDAYIVLALLVFNAVIGFIQEHNASGAVEALKQKLQVSAKVIRDRIWKLIPARELVPGDVLRIRIGDFVPADVKIVDGEISLDQSALTGESLELEKTRNDRIFSGSVVTKGEATVLVMFTGGETKYGKTIELVKDAGPKSHIEEVISNVVRWLLFIVGILLSIALIVSYLKGIQLLDILPLLLVLLLGAIPVALTAMFTVCMALGSKEVVREGVLITRLSAPDDAASMDILCVDKTGTLTTNSLSIANVSAATTYTSNDVVLFGALASQVANHDAIDMAFIDRAAQLGDTYSSFTQKTFIPFDAKTRKTEADISQGEIKFKVLKGSFHVISEYCALDPEINTHWETQTDAFGKQGFRTLAIAKMYPNRSPEFVGLVALHDPPRADSRELIQAIEQLGITVKMLTGDALPIALEIAQEVGIGKSILVANDLRNTAHGSMAQQLGMVNGVAEVYPQDKYDIIKALQAEGHVVGMTGDGVNDAPALKQAEVGIAVRSATDVAKGAASMVLTQDGLVNILSPIRVGREMFERINTWILNKIARTILKTGFVVIAFIVLGHYVITASAMLIMIFMTDFVKISLATDHVTGSQKPARWNINGLARIAVVVGLMMMLEAFGILFIGLKWFHLRTDNPALSTYCFEILLFFAIFSIFIVREKRHFWQSAPSRTLLFLLIADLIAGVLLSTLGLLGFRPIPFGQTVINLIYTGFFSFVVNDLVKCFLFKKWPVET